MNHDLEHQQLVKLLNKRAENQRMAKLESAAAPLFWMMMIVVVAVTLWGIV